MIVLSIAVGTTFNKMFIYNSITHTDYLILYDVKDTFWFPVYCYSFIHLNW